MPILGLLGGVVALLAEHFIFPGFSWNRDEPVYLWQAELLRHGQLTMSDAGFPRVLHPWLSGHHDGVFFSQYPLGWPVALVVGQLVGWPGLTLALAAVGAVTGTYALAREVTGERRIAAMASLLLLGSPILALQGGVYLTYVFALGVGTWFATSFVAGVRLRSRRRLVVAGLLLGLMVMTRTFDAVMWGAAVGGFTLVADRRSWRELARLVPWFVGAVVPLVVLQLLHNRHLTGNPFEFPITVADPLDTFGFGARRLMPAMDKEHYTLAKAVRGTAKNAFFLPWFLAGAYLGVVVAAIGAIGHRRHRSTWLLVALAVAFPIGYFPFWGTAVSALASRISGPIYFVPVYVPLCVLMAQGFLVLARRSPRSAAIAALAVAVVTVPVGYGRMELNRRMSRIQMAWQDSTDQVVTPAVVVVSPSDYVFQLNPDGGNGPDVGGDIIWATDTDPEVIDLIEANPERRSYVQRADVAAAEQLPLESIEPYEVDLVPAEIIRSRVLTIPVSVLGRRLPAVSVALEIGDSVYWRDMTVDATPGSRIETTWRVAEDAVTAGVGGLAVPTGPDTLAVLVGFGRTSAEARANPSLRYEILVKSGSVMKALVPGSVLEPDSGITDELVWRDAGTVSGFEVSVRAG